MAAAAGPAAGPDEVAARIRAESDKQLDTMYQSVHPLKGEDFHSFEKQLKRQAFAYEWHAHILDRAVAVPAEPDLKVRRDIRNAYLVITNKTDEHPVRDLLQNCPIGDGRQAFIIVHDYFHRRTQTGRIEANNAFYSATMATTDTNIVQWLALVPRRAQILIRAGGTADDAAILSVMLGGLLPEFKPVQLILTQDTTLTREDAISRLIDFAQAERLTTVTKGGSRQRQNNTFSVESLPRKPKRPCFAWADGTCKYGRDCRYSHDGPMGVSKDNRQVQRRTLPPLNSVPVRQTPDAPLVAPSSSVNFSSSVRCDYCTGVGHLRINCPQLQDDDKVGYVFMSETKEPDTQTKGPGNYIRWTLVVLGMIGVFTGAFSAIVAGVRSVPSRGWVVILVALGVWFSGIDLPRAGASTVRASIYFNSSGASIPEYEWCCDTGTNRFVTNDLSDFVEGTVVHETTRVAVGGGTTDSPCNGSVLIRSLDFGHIIRCNKTLYMPACGKKLIPASPFIQQGCRLVLGDGVKVSLTSTTGDRLLEGKENGGLYYFHCATVKSPETSCVKVSPHRTFFGLTTGKMDSTSQDFSRRLLEAHWAYGHLHFKKLRREKILRVRHVRKPSPE